MGSNTIVTETDGTIANATAVNQYKTALVGDVLPRTAGGAVQDVIGSLGTPTIEWLKAHIASGYWSIGDIKPHHSFNGAAAIGQGWFPCLGGVINETNYDAIHGAGAWDIYVGTSLLDGKYAPSLAGKYLTGSAATSQSGAAPITSVGNAGNTVDIQHSHTVDSHSHSHNHQWHDSTAAGTDNKVFNSSGSPVTPASSTATLVGDVTLSTPLTVSVNGQFVASDYYTDNDATTSTSGTGDSLSTAQTVRPESIEVIYYIRII